MSEATKTRTRDELVKLVGAAGADNYLSFPDERSHAVLVKSVDALTAERNDLRDRIAKLESDDERLREACGRVCRETDWCPVCEQNPSSGHRRDCLLQLGEQP